MACRHRIFALVHRPAGSVVALRGRGRPIAGFERRRPGQGLYQSGRIFHHQRLRRGLSGDRGLAGTAVPARRAADVAGAAVPDQPCLCGQQPHGARGHSCAARLAGDPPIPLDGAFLAFAAATFAIGRVVWTSSPYLRERGRERRGRSARLRHARAPSPPPACGSNSTASRSISLPPRRCSAMAPGRSRPLFQRAIAGQSGMAGDVRRQSASADARPSRSSSDCSARRCCGRCGSPICCCSAAAALVAWFGLVVVVQNIIGSLFNSHLFDFTQGWAYVFGVGVAAG